VPFANFQSSRFWVALCSFERFALIFCFISYSTFIYS
jgi:hypothetical protein